jgi:hypothetical protein
MGGSLQKRDRHERNPTTEADVLDLLILPGTIPARVVTAGRRG